MKYDIFISYRRIGGFETARHLFDLLSNDGYRVSFDIDTLRNGEFDIQLLKRIRKCKDFILIVDKHTFDRTLDPDFEPKNDWLRCELRHALKYKKNVIPIFLSGVDKFPNDLPKDIKDVARMNGPQYDKYYFTDFYRKLKKFLISHGRTYRLIKYGSIILTTIIAMYLALMSIPTKNNNEAHFIDPTAINYSTELDFTLYAATTLENYLTNKNLTHHEIFQKLSKEAERGMSESQFLFALCYVSGFYVDQNYERAVEILKLAAERGNMQAQFSLGICYINGLGVNQDYITASKFLKQSAEQGFAPAQYNYAIFNFPNDKFYENMKAAALQDFAPAQLALSKYLRKYDFYESKYWCNLAVEQHYIWALLYLAELYAYSEIESERSIWSSIDILTKLSDIDFSYAQLQLGLLYYSGGLPNDNFRPDKRKAFEFLNKAANSGNIIAITYVGIGYLNGENYLNNEQQDFRKAMEHFLIAAKSGYSYAYIQIANMYKNGLGVDKDLKEATKWEEKAKNLNPILYNY